LPFLTIREYQTDAIVYFWQQCPMRAGFGA
jgi:hypothetical protein